MRARPRRRSLLHLVIALVAGGLIVAVLVVRNDPTPVVVGDSLVTEAAENGDGLPGTRVIQGVGHDICQDRDEIERAGRRHPRRIVLAYTGKAISDRVHRAAAEFGVQGLGLVYASCLRDVRKSVPAAVQLVVVQPLACGPGDLHGSPVLADYLRAATLGGTYPSGIPVAPMRNASYTTAVDDRLTPGHRYRDRDAGGVLRTDDALHLTAYGARVYAGVLHRLATPGS
jgi:hypothetical protein